MLNTKDFKNIIFDLGGVILNIDYNKTLEAFKKLGIVDFELVYSQAKQDKLFDLYETGRISSEGFIEELITRCGSSVCSEDIINAWNAMLLDLPEERLRLLNRLKKQNRLFLLSNTNEIHINAYNAYLGNTFGFKDLENYFEKQYLSYEIGKRKPNPEVFELVLNENQLHPSETVFIDDSIQHIEGARTAGISAFHLEPGKTILDIFS